MNNRVGMFLAVIGIFGLLFCGSGQAATGTLNVESAENVPVYGPSETDFAGTPSGTEGAAIELTPVDSSWPQAPNPPSITGNSELEGATWITTPTTPPTDAAPTFSLFQDTFTPPCTASNLAGTLYTAANNAETIYFNNNLLDSTPSSGTNPPLPSLESFEFVPVQGENTFDFDVTREPPTESVSNPAGLIYNAVISFTVPDVVWRPPIVGTGRTILKNGTTLPIKFVLKTDAGVLHKAQDVYLSITGPGVDVQFAPGQGLKFARGNGQYHANFHTKNYKLETGAQYTVSVNDACSGTPLGSPITMTISGKEPHHGKK